MNLSKLPQRNEHVTLALRDTGEVVHGWVKKTGREIRIMFVREEKGAHVRLGGTVAYVRRVKRTYTVRRRDEGVVWARGWEGEGPDALRAAAALA
jgi:hypothetical protein